MGEYGRGGLGRVSRAHDQDLGRDVAIKELLHGGVVSELRFAREALITARLEHPGIVPVYEAGRWPDGTPFYAMKLVSGRPLRALIAERTTVEDRINLLHHVIAVADAMAYAHGRNIIHRDLKPANVIVGEFGETVVIDWGLAKNLSEASALDQSPGAVRPPNDQLTSTGAVLGTPAYMAPEQERGDVVDRRSDVFAIGIMLWELCSLDKAPPMDAALRRQMLRRAGLDDDLTTIVNKAIDPDPARRYPDAGALASDLKAFKAGSRIASRRYSLLELCEHWIRRHRALALSITVVFAVIAFGSTLFVWNLAVARDRAEAANGELTLERVALLMQADPTAALQVLAGYHGRDELRRDRLRAEAKGRGVAQVILTPHTDTVWLAVGEPSGAIVTVGEDRRIQLSHGAISLTLATDVAPLVRVTYNPVRRMIAYATTTGGIAMLDLRTRQVRPVAAFDPQVLTMSMDGNRLAAIDRAGVVKVWSTEAGAAVVYSAQVSGATRVRFATTSRVVVQDARAIHAFPLDTAGGTADTLAFTNVSSLDASARGVVVGTSAGELAMLSPELAVVARTSMCSKRVRIVRWIPGSDRVAFACQDRIAGIARYDTESTNWVMVDSFAAEGGVAVYPDAGGDYVTIVDDVHAYVYDTRTGLQHHYNGAAGQPSYVAAPSPDYPHVLIGDVNGNVRVWEPPGRAAKVITQISDGAIALAFSLDSTVVAAGGIDRAVHQVELTTGRELVLHGHGSFINALHMAPDAKTFASVSYDGEVRVWNLNNGSQLQAFGKRGTMVADTRYIEGGSGVVSVGNEGQLIAWSIATGISRVVFRQASPLVGLRVLHAGTRGERVVVFNGTGDAWDVALDGAAHQIRHGGAEITTIRISNDGRYAAIGTGDGGVELYDTATWQQLRQIRMEGSIRRIAFDPHNRDLAIASEAGRTLRGHVQIEPLDVTQRAAWRQVPARVRDIAYSPDGEVLGFVCDDGGTWLYSMHDHAWVYARDHETDVLVATFSPDGRLLASGDRRGLVVVRDVAMTFARTRD